MNLISSLSSIASSALRPTPNPVKTDLVGAGIGVGAPAANPGVGAPTSFEKLIGAVESKQAEASAITRDVLLGNNPNIHQSVIAMQEASLSFSLMVEVRNKVIESYQELMRMSV
jgi:flagellar hook-basal body complex protein FliE